jgi:hypothetical protein
MTRWQYKVTTVAPAVNAMGPAAPAGMPGPEVTTTEDLVARHMREMDSNGWELLNGSTVWGTRGIAYTMWWRKTGPAPTPYEEPRPYTMDI